MNAPQWIFIFAGVSLLLAARLRYWALIPLGLGYALALVEGQVDARAAIPLLLLLAAGWAIAPARALPVKVLGHLIFIALAADLLLHWVPGFHNPRLVGPERLTPDAVPFSMYLNLDKPLVGFFLILAWPYLQLSKPPRSWMTAGALAGGATVIACLAAAFLLKFVAWAPKWPEWGWLWLLNNLLLVCLAEEALFRGYVQEGLARAFAGARASEWIAIGIASALFGAAHFAGGWPLMLLAALAGLGYGTAYKYGGLQAAILAHLVLNTTHFALFTYPALA